MRNYAKRMKKIAIAKESWNETELKKLLALAYRRCRKDLADNFSDSVKPNHLPLLAIVVSTKAKNSESPSIIKYHTQLPKSTLPIFRLSCNIGKYLSSSHSYQDDYF